MCLTRAESLCASFNDKPANFIVVFVGLGPNDRNVRHRSIGDPRFRSIQQPAIGHSLGSSQHSRWIRAMIWLSKPKASDDLAGRHLRQPFALLVLAAELEYWIHTESPLDGGKASDPGVSRLQLLH